MTGIAVEANCARAEGVFAVARTHAELAPVTVPVNNAGATKYEPFTERAEQKWDETVESDLEGPFLVTRAIVGDMLDAGRGESSTSRPPRPRAVHRASPGERRGDRIHQGTDDRVCGHRHHRQRRATGLRRHPLMGHPRRPGSRRRADADEAHGRCGGRRARRHLPCRARRHPRGHEA
ncbi:SDR family NAD(P)-dependent oxidoreductase [Pseudonocardia parietis]|uniref:SDR family NAD(P)-dependent oxidoreductase n=1 Tax=Pseudonocardia parietis TaxID=570936 RepID=UPI0027DE4A6B|nr:SDR family NAD(P)-dependent oxidoreductase [Pseudonocardia parietis]